MVAEHLAALRYGKVGLPTSVKASITEDRRILIKAKSDGKVILDVDITQISKPGKSTALIGFTAEGKYYSLEFIAVWQKLIVITLLGFIPYLIFLSKGNKVSADWKRELEACGHSLKGMLW